ncbi:MAG: 2OG-Fe dioxygenase family protein [Sphingobium sp.]
MNDLCLLDAAITKNGYARIPGADMFGLLQLSPDDWARFAASWNDLGPDLYMADGGRYRRRRHATFRCEQGIVTRQPHQPHYQSRDHNRLNGDVQRWFEPILPPTVENAAMQAILSFCAAMFARDGARHHVEMHQFRIEASPDAAGQPTPEGMHRDGVDKVLVMLVERHNVREGVTRIGTPEGATLGTFTLAAPGDAALIDDHRIHHGVTEIHPLDPALPAWRDALVVTFAAI